MEGLVWMVNIMINKKVLFEKRTSISVLGIMTCEVINDKDFDTYRCQLPFEIEYTTV